MKEKEKDNVKRSLRWRSTFFCKYRSPSQVPFARLEQASSSIGLYVNESKT